MAIADHSSLEIRRFIMVVKPVSEQLSDLSVRAKKAEDAAAAAKKEGAEKAQQREDEIKAAAAQRKADAQQKAAEAKDSVAAAWTDITTKVESDVDDIRTRIDVKKYEHDRNKAAKKADDAEENAVRAISFALDSIDYAEIAVLDAMAARATADAM
jgi:hypothetical protein